MRSEEGQGRVGGEEGRVGAPSASSSRLVSLSSELPVLSERVPASTDSKYATVSPGLAAPRSAPAAPNPAAPRFRLLGLTQPSFARGANPAPRSGVARGVSAPLLAGLAHGLGGTIDGRLSSIVAACPFIFAICRLSLALSWSKLEQLSEERASSVFNRPSFSREAASSLRHAASSPSNDAISAAPTAPTARSTRSQSSLAPRDAAS